LTFFKRLIDSIDGTKKSRSDSDAIFTLSSAYISLEAKLDLESTGRCGICVEKTDNDAAAAELNELKVIIENLLDASKKTDFKLSYGIQIDTYYGQLWIIVDAKTLEDSIACITVMSETLEEMGPLFKLQSAVFEFGKDGNKQEPFYLIYDHELDKFYPFVPIIGRQKARNNQQEINIMKAVEDDKLPFEEDPSKWYPKWNLPF
jgi:hypothetical protein